MKLEPFSISNRLLPNTQLSFWLAYFINIVVVFAFASQMQFGNYLASLNVTQVIGGMILGIGILAGIFYKFFLGSLLDRLNIKLLWGASILIMALGSLIYAFTDHFNLNIYLARILFVAGYGGSVTCGVVYIQRLAENQFKTSVLGFYGTSGFIGLFLGPQINDLMQSYYSNETAFYLATFSLISVACGLAFLLTMLLKNLSYDVREVLNKSSVKLSLSHLEKISFGVLLATAFAVGMSFAIPQYFLALYAKSIGITEIGMFFAGYTAFGVAVRTFGFYWRQETSRRLLLISGLFVLTISQLLLATGLSWAAFLIPGALAGMGRSLLEPSLLTLAADNVPIKNRGFSTSMMFVAIDAGIMFSGPALALIAKQYSFSFMFYSLSFALLCMTGLHIVLYFLQTYRSPEKKLQKLGISVTDWFDTKQSHQTKILITGRLHGMALKSLYDNPNMKVLYFPHASRSDLTYLIKNADVLICRYETIIDQAILENAPKLRLIGSATTNLSHIDVAFCEKQGIEVINTPSRNSDELAEMCLGTLKDVISITSNHTINDKVNNLTGLKIGIWGVNSTSLKLAEQASSFGMSVVFYDEEQNLIPKRYHSSESLKNLIQKIDVLVLAAKLNINSYQKIDSSLIKNFNGVYIINISSNQLINQSEIIKNLKSNKVSAYICDILDEPLSPDDKLLINHKKVFCTPHIVGLTKESYFQTGQTIIESIEDLYDRRSAAPRLSFEDKQSVSFDFIQTSNDFEFSALINDVSNAGIGIQCSNELVKGEKIIWQVNENEQVLFEVKWSVRTSLGKYRVGLALSKNFAKNLITTIEQYLHNETPTRINERRKHKRSFDPQVVWADYLNERIAIEILNKSDTGICLRSAKIMNVGQKIKLSQNSEEVIANIKWRSALVGCLYVYGLEFVAESSVIHPKIAA